MPLTGPRARKVDGDRLLGGGCGRAREADVGVIWTATRTRLNKA